ncbi:MAG: family 78 glycoside hydrolase catalytic domain [Microbacterium sp.]|nr:family 78 glycoside hydrolase catalytic domain [Microbacterium sp.]
MTGTVRDLAPSAVAFEHLGADVCGIGESRPRLSWVLPDRAAGSAEPTAYELHVSSASGAETFVVQGPGGVLSPWPAVPLSTAERREVRVRVLFADGTRSMWSPTSSVEAGLLHPDDWSASFVGATGGDTGDPLPLLRRVYEIPDGVVRARLRTTAHGMYTVLVDGEPIDDALLEPGWQSYHHRLRYRTHDVTRFARSGRIVIGALLADGWYRGRLGFPLIARDRVYGSQLGFLAQLELDLADGRRVIQGTDGSWRWRPGPILSAGLYDGQHDDERLRVDWSSDDDGWMPVAVHGRPSTRLVAPSAPPVRAQETLAPQRIWTSPSGRTLVDFGQNLVGWIRLRVRGEAGTRITLRHAEVLEHGELGTRPLRDAAAEDSVILDGRGETVWEPRFTYHGFRYVEVSGWPGDRPDVDAVEAVVVHSDLTRTGWFSCSDPLLDRLHENVVWAMRGNVVDIPTDCPQRDERLGWTGDIAVFAPTATFLYDCAGFLDSWLEDLALEQRDDGTVPFFVPELPIPEEVSHLPGLAPQPAAVWGDAAVLVPMALHDATGDVGILARQYPSMCAWVSQVERLAGETRVWDTGFQFGDWLDPSAPAEDPAAGRTDPALVATAYFAHSARLLARASEAIALPDDAVRWRALADEVDAGFRRRFLDETTGLLRCSSPTAYALALHFDLVPSHLRERAGAELVRLVRADGHRIGTGFAGTPVLLHALSGVGADEDAYALIQQTECPSWLYTVRMGATTIWERWDSMLPDGSINPGEMTSFNHYALGAVGAWMHEHIGGLRRTAPGWTEVLIAPRPRGGLTAGSASHRGPRGLISVSWRVHDDGTLRVEVQIPAGTDAVLDLPGITPERLGGGAHVRSVAIHPRQEASIA